MLASQSAVCRSGVLEGRGRAEDIPLGPGITSTARVRPWGHARPQAGAMPAGLAYQRREAQQDDDGVLEVLIDQRQERLGGRLLEPVDAKGLAVRLDRAGSCGLGVEAGVGVRAQCLGQPRDATKAAQQLHVLVLQQQGGVSPCRCYQSPAHSPRGVAHCVERVELLRADTVGRGILLEELHVLLRDDRHPVQPLGALQHALRAGGARDPVGAAARGLGSWNRCVVLLGRVNGHEGVNGHSLYKWRPERRARAGREMQSE
jgi:hypothetical protein